MAEGEEQVSEDDVDAGESKRKRVKIADRDDLFGDDGLEMLAARRGQMDMQLIASLQSKYATSSSKIKANGSLRKERKPIANDNNEKQVDWVRKRAVEAYAKLREKRRSESAAYQK